VKGKNKAFQTRDILEEKRGRKYISVWTGGRRGEHVRDYFLIGRDQEDRRGVGATCEERKRQLAYGGEEVGTSKKDKDIRENGTLPHTGKRKREKNFFFLVLIPSGGRETILRGTQITSNQEGGESKGALDRRLRGGRLSCWATGRGGDEWSRRQRGKKERDGDERSGLAFPGIAGG